MNRNLIKDISNLHSLVLIESSYPIVEGHFADAHEKGNFVYKYCDGRLRRPDLAWETRMWLSRFGMSCYLTLTVNIVVLNLPLVNSMSYIEYENRRLS